MRRVDIRLTTEQVTVLDKLASILGSTRSELVRQAVASIEVFFRILEKKDLNEKEIRDIMRLFLASKVVEMGLRSDFEVLWDIMKSPGVDEFLSYIKEEEEKRSKKEVTKGV